jgi:DNA-binding MarR family transcriptional regulator
MAANIKDDHPTFHVPASRVLKVLSRLRELHNDMTILQAMIFFRIAAEPGVTQRTVWRELDTYDSVASRGVAVLSSAGVKGAHGRKTEPLHLIELRENPDDRRERMLYLTRKGRTLMEDIIRDLDMAERPTRTRSSSLRQSPAHSVRAEDDKLVKVT